MERDAIEVALRTMRMGDECDLLKNGLQVCALKLLAIDRCPTLESNTIKPTANAARACFVPQ